MLLANRYPQTVAALYGEFPGGTSLRRCGSAAGWAVELAHRPMQMQRPLSNLLMPISSAPFFKIPQPICCERRPPSRAVLACTRAVVRRFPLIFNARTCDTARLGSPRILLPFRSPERLRAAPAPHHRLGREFHAFMFHSSCTNRDNDEPALPSNVYFAPRLAALPGWARLNGAHRRPPRFLREGVSLASVDRSARLGYCGMR